MIKRLEMAISSEFGGSTKFEMEDLHALYFHHANCNVETEFKVVKEDNVLWKLPKGSEDWNLTLLTTSDLLPDSTEKVS